ncbi:MAG: type II toxin-antitoxin system HipA family toxin [Cyanobacteria bacterium TGS_CYA1]|nr:type II toxin-antitoxin system HipA family toxin [Cyanobacteria bacterium TGS_CYA1]
MNKLRPKILNVFVSDVLAGRLICVDGDYHTFEIDRGYDWGKGHPVLSLSLKAKHGGIDYSELHSRTQLPPFFSNLLPEGHLREYLAAKARVRPQREFALLNALKDDLPGALKLEAAGKIQDKSASTFRVEAREEFEWDESLRFSLAGIQLKFSALESAGKLTIPAHGVGGDYIVKLPSLRYKNVPENEYSMMQLARMVGIETAEVELRKTSSIKRIPKDISENFGQSLVVKRFDRDKSKRIHIEDFAQIFKIYPRDKYSKVSYGGIANVVFKEGGNEQLLEFVRRLTFALLIGNADMHLKNWSVIYRQPQKATLSPAYDMISTISYLPDYQMALSVAGEKSMHKIGEAHFRNLAAKMLLPENLVVNEMRDTKEKFLEVWAKSKSDLPISGNSRKNIDQHLDKLSI